MPVVQERPSLKMKFKMTQEKKKDTKEEHTKEQKAEKTSQREKCVVIGHNRIKETKLYGLWVPGIQKERKRNREANRGLL